MNTLDLLHRFILGALAATLVAATAWLATGGDFPGFWPTFLGSQLLILAAAAWIRARRRREQQQIRDMFERPAYGDDTTE